jgi:hypothetical protein
MAALDDYAASIAMRSDLQGAFICTKTSTKANRNDRHHCKCHPHYHALKVASFHLFVYLSQSSEASAPGSQNGHHYSVQTGGPNFLAKMLNFSAPSFEKRALFE